MEKHLRTHCFKKVELTDDIISEHAYYTRKLIDGAAIKSFDDWLYSYIRYNPKKLSESEELNYKKWYNDLKELSDNDEFMVKIYEKDQDAILRTWPQVDLYPLDTDYVGQYTTIYENGYLYSDNYKIIAPFRISYKTDTKFTDAESLITFLKSCKSEDIVTYINGNDGIGLNEDVENWIKNFFRNNSLIMFDYE